jgi:arylsulfatase A-like enzyme
MSHVAFHRPILSLLPLLAFAACRDTPNPLPPRAALPQAPKNVILISLDALRQDHLSVFGYPRPTSPNIDWLATHGVAYRSIVPSGCSTKTSLTSLLTALDYDRHGILDHGDLLPGSILTLAEAFQTTGYETFAYVATPHLAAELNYDQGFDHFNDFTDLDSDYIRAEQIIDHILTDLDSPTVGNTPFFIYTHFEEPHPPRLYGSPWLNRPEPSQRFFDRSCTFVPSAADLAAFPAGKRDRLIAKYDAAIRHADACIGLLLDSLRRLDLLQNSIIGITTDHGLELLGRYSATHGYTPFDEVVRTFLVLYDGSETIETPFGTDIQGRIFDIGPTLMARAGLPIPAEFQGVDLLQHADLLPSVAFSTCYNAQVARSLDYKLIWFDYSRKRVRKKNKPVGYREGPLLFDLRTDPGETRDIGQENPAAFKSLVRALDGYRERTGQSRLKTQKVEDINLQEETTRRLRSLGYID